MTSAEFIAESVQNKSGKNAELRSIWFNGKRVNKSTGGYDEHVYPKFQRYMALDFRRIAETTTGEALSTNAAAGR
jgi:hypothetical protein